MATTPEKLGNKNRVYVTDALASSISSVEDTDWVAGETTNTLNLNGNQIEVSDKNSGAWQKFIPGVKGGTIDATFNTLDADEKQKSLLASFMAGQTVFLFVGDLDAGVGYACEAIISSISETNDNAAVSSRSISFVANGEVKRIEAV